MRDTSSPTRECRRVIAWKGISMACVLQSGPVIDTEVQPSSCPVCSYPHRRMIEYLLETGEMPVKQIAIFYFELTPEQIQSHHDNCEFITEGAIC